ncbi:GHKL domain-containing protein [Marinifilum sp. N1E240]|uniref:sensor histidine kinase n=1 Tax=Marinifilum sp. N1E240 TaxID=2608082 RepID=UPI00128CBB31|nr:histidine kinase [Marinifilum sp. N1E240]MPQ47720.1 GHKL domain-containing protein [Marinifilum sp. N1E240]
MQIITSDNKWLSIIINNRAVQHLSYWIIFVLFFAYAWGTYDANYLKTIKVELINLPVKILLVYSVIYYLYPKFLFNRKIWLFLFFFVIFVSLAAVLQRITDNLIIVEYFFPNWEKAPTFSFSQIVRSAVNLGSVLVLPMTVKIMEYLAMVQQNEQILAKEKVEAELSFLKNQVQPHFLFNTLNSLYSLILKKSDQSLDVVLKLSELLRYMLYETNSTQVDLPKEIDCIKSYLDLEKIRYSNRIDLSLNIWGDINTNRIAPMIILPFLENAFKHSTKGFDGQAWITIEIGIKNKDLILKIENSIPNSSSDQDSIVGGIGLQNVKRRLSLIYPKRHDLKIERTEETYCVHLNLEL